MCYAPETNCKIASALVTLALCKNKNKIILHHKGRFFSYHIYVSCIPLSCMTILHNQSSPSHFLSLIPCTPPPPSPPPPSLPPPPPLLHPPLDQPVPYTVVADYCVLVVALLQDGEEEVREEMAGSVGILLSHIYPLVGES